MNLEKNSLDEILDASKNIDNFGILAPISSKNEYPNYELEKNTEFDPIKPFKVESVDGFAMVLNLKRLKKIDLIKLDIEGQELEAIKGSKSIIKNIKNIKIIFEVNIANNRDGISNTTKIFQIYVNIHVKIQ